MFNFNHMKKYCFLPVIYCICVGLIFVSCDHDDDTTGSGSVSAIHAVVVNGASFDLDIAKAVIRPEDSDLEYLVGAGEYQNGKFTIELPENIPEMYLVNLDAPDWAKVSEKNVNGGIIMIEGYKSGEYVNNFAYGKIEMNNLIPKITVGAYTYVDKDVKITGTYSEKDEAGYTSIFSFDVFLKKGWNIMYVSLSLALGALTIDVATSDPGGMKWYFQDDNFDLDLDFGFGAVSLQNTSGAKH